MAVPEQIPVVNYVADGVVKKFDVPFEYDQQSDLHLYVDGNEPTIDKYFFADNAFNFYIAPTNGQGVKIKRITPKERDTDYDLHTNTVRPKALNSDFDRLWYVIQEVFSDVGGLSQAVQDEIIARIQGDEDLLNQLTAEISARMLGDEAVTDDLKNYVDQVIGAIINDPDFDGIDAKNVNDASGETQQQVNYNGGSKWHSRVGGYLENERVVLANGDIVKSTVDGNTNDPNTDLTGWINPEAEQARINDANVVMIDLFSSVATALDWVKSNVNNYLYVKAGTTYTLPTGNVYFNRVICLDGKADFIVPAATNLGYINFTDGSEVLCLKNIRFLIAGHRGTLTTSTSFVYTSVNTVKNANLENLEIYGLTDTNNIDSWRDDVGMTRVQGFINYRVSESSRIANVNFYGVAHFAIVDTVSSGAIHSEENVNGYNAETGIYFPAGMWRSGTSKNINVFNNDLQKDYWINRDRAVSPSGRNGKNCIMCEADHNISYVIDGANMVYGIEKSVYCTSTNSVVRNTSDDKCFSMTTIKSPKDAGVPKSAIDGFNLICRNPTNSVGVQDTYGWLKGVLERVRIENDVKSITKPFIFSDLGHLTCKNLFAKNTGIPLYFAGGNNISKLEVIDSEFVDCYDANLSSLYFKGAGTKTIGELAIDNVRHYCADISIVPVANIPTVGIALDGVIKFKFNNSRSFAKVNLFSKSAVTTYIEVINSKFVLKNSDLISAMWNNLKTVTIPQANVFDFTIDFLTTNTTVSGLKVDARFKKINDSGMVNCAEYWSDINIGYPVTVANGISLMAVGDKSFELTASFNDKMLKFYWDAVAKTITPVANLGGLFATTQTLDKINVYVNPANNLLVINIGNGTWTGGTGGLSVSLKRF